jgi:tetratricopeptide (TPR) repeat protein
VLLADYSRSGGYLTRIYLARLSRSDVEQWIRMSLSSADSSLVDRIFAESEGLPLFIQEYLALLRLNPDLQQEADWRMPLEMHELLRSRIAQVSDIARQILDSGAVIGRSFDMEMVQECSGRDESEAVDAADELERWGLLRDLGASTMMYEFSHEKLRTIVYQDMSLARRRLLHRRAAKALLNRVGQTDKLCTTAALIAAHFHAGGQDAEAADFYAQAGYYARGLYANREALHYFEQALALGYLHPAELYAPIGDLHTMLGDYRAAIRSYENGKAYAKPAQFPTFEQKLGQVHHRLGEWELANSYYRDGFTGLPDVALIERASFLTDHSLTKVATGDLTGALSLAQAALDMAEQTTDVRVKAQAHNMMGLLARKREQFDLAARHLYASLSLAESLKDDGMYVAVLNNLGLLHMETHQYGEAQRLFEVALQKCKLLGDLHREAALHNNLADLFHAFAMPDEALRHLKIAVSLFVKVGRQDTETRTETWKLTEW